MKLEKRFCRWILWVGVLHAVEDDFERFRQHPARRETWSGAQGVISPFEQERNEAIAVTDTPHVLSAAFVYELPVGSGKRYLNAGGVKNALLGGWQMSTIFRYSSGLPLFFRVEARLQRPRTIPGRLHSRHHQPGRRLRAGEGAVRPGQGTAVGCDGVRTSRARSTSTQAGAIASRRASAASVITTRISSFVKNARVPGGTNLQLRVEVFNFWNWHMFTYGAWGDSAFNTDLSSPDFGTWNGTVSDPRSIQLAARFEF